MESKFELTIEFNSGQRIKRGNLILADKVTGHFINFIFKYGLDAKSA